MLTDAKTCVVGYTNGAVAQFDFHGEQLIHVVKAVDVDPIGREGQVNKVRRSNRFCLGAQEITHRFFPIRLLFIRQCRSLLPLTMTKKFACTTCVLGSALARLPRTKIPWLRCRSTPQACISPVAVRRIRFRGGSFVNRYSHTTSGQGTMDHFASGRLLIATAYLSKQCVQAILLGVVVDGYLSKMLCRRTDQKWAKLFTQSPSTSLGTSSRLAARTAPSRSSSERNAVVDVDRMACQSNVVRNQFDTRKHTKVSYTSRNSGRAPRVEQPARSLVY